LIKIIEIIEPFPRKGLGAMKLPVSN